MLKLEARNVFMEQFPNKEKQKIYASIRTFMTGHQKPAKIQKRKWKRKIFTPTRKKKLSREEMINEQMSLAQKIMAHTLKFMRMFHPRALRKTTSVISGAWVSIILPIIV